jgi:hypothetical protein
MTKEERKKIKDTYKDKVPEPLTSQFLEKTPTSESIKCYRERKAKTAFHQVNEKPLLPTPQKLLHNNAINN